jgi:tyrosine-protein kinase Etk/Wzc
LKFCLLPAGGTTANPTELLQTEAFSRIMQRLSPHFDWILIDSPPVIPLTDAVSLTHHTDSTLLVARAGRTPQKAIDTAITLLGPKHVIGVVLNGVEGLDRAYSKYAGYYSSDAASSEGDKKRTESQNGSISECAHEVAPVRKNRVFSPSQNDGRHLL